VSFVIAVVLFVAVWTRWTLRNLARQPLLRRRNYRGEEVIGSAGLAIVGASLLGWLLLGWREELRWQESALLMATAFWFSVLGLMDDIAGETQVKGWRGHFSTLLKERRLTMGMVKAIGGGVGALILSAWAMGVLGQFQWERWLLGAMVIALSANALNLLDVRPSRALKGFWLLSLLGVGVTRGDGWLAFVPLWASTLAYAPDDFRRKAMLGDAGANPLGACFGVWVTLHWSLTAQVLLLLVLIAFHLYAERRSLTADIERVALLRWLDRWGVRA
jgi:UDP-N-acetylmuramyl pentapeptide phosphotransferase/UDP-N-acetylglucosamine-1-phosphate transferase